MSSMLYQTLAYLQYRIKAKNRHGVHSPWVYTLNDVILPDIYSYYAFDNIEQLRKKLLNDNSWIDVLDLGAGSKHHNGKQRSVQHITKYTSKSPALCRLLFRLVNYIQPDTILELGTSMGISTAYLASAAKESRVTTIEGNPHIAAYAQNNLKELGLQNVEVINNSFDLALPALLESAPTPKFIFIDGNHEYNATLRYFKTLTKNIEPGSLMVFDDIHWSKGMQQAWQEIIKDNINAISVDLFHIGLLYFQPNISKQHYVLHYDNQSLF